MPPGMEEMLRRAKAVTDATGCPVVGGIAVVLHGGGRTTRDIDIYSEDFWATHTLLESAGYQWVPSRREHLVDGVPVHMVKEDSLGGPPKRISTIRGIKVIGLADLVRGKLTVGLSTVSRSKDIADVLELIRIVPLKKDFAAKLPTKLRSAFKRLVNEIHEPRRTTLRTLRLWDDAPRTARRASSTLRSASSSTSPRRSQSTRRAVTND
ncbi:MAG: hypothetical protein K2X32_07915 [Phycisphaerales bacterium]|nr:hypothetical protein [Phycisphaerales bacterium]